MKFQVQEKIFTIEDKYVDYSPFLKTLTETELQTQRVNGAYLIQDIEPLEFMEYLKFLIGDATFIYVPELFDFMGHPNTFRYPDEYFKIKLYDDWLRDNAYRLNLFADPYYGLIEVPTNDIFKQRAEEVLKAVERKYGPEKPTYPLLGGNFYIAGGSVLYLLGLLDNFRDVDIFTTSIDKTKQYAQGLIDQYKSEAKREYGLLYEAGKLHVTDHSFSFTDYHSWSLVQFILRQYTCPSEIVHGFDVGSCCLITDGLKVWTTMRGMYSLATLTNWFDPSRSSETYDTRLCKYHNRGFRIMLPMVDEISLNNEAYQRFKDAVLKEYYSNVHEIGGLNEEVENEKEEYLEEAFDPAMEDAIDEVMQYAKATPEQIAKYKLIHSHGNPIVNALMWIRDDMDIDLHQKQTPKIAKRWSNFKRSLPSGPASLLILERLGYSYNLILLNYGRYINSDYEKGENKEFVVVSQLNFKEQNPMEQVSSTFYPEPIISPEALISFYETSPLVAMGHDNSALDNDKVRFVLRKKQDGLDLMLDTTILKDIMEQLDLI